MKNVTNTKAVTNKTLVEKRLVARGELGATELELLVPLRKSILLHWEFQDFNQGFFTGVGQYQGFVDYFKY